MVLSSLQLEAFSELAKTRNFSQAAKNLHITQSALSQRILKLETELATGLIIRDPSGLRLTVAGMELLRYCRTKENLEAEVLTKISSSQKGMGGVIKIGGFSSVMRSVVMRALAELVATHSGMKIEIFIRELGELPKMLSNNEIDLIVTADLPFRHEVVSHDIGIEKNVLVEAINNRNAEEVYLDHDVEDTATMNFFKINGQPHKELRRNFLDEVYSIIDGVKLGWGRAVLPLHLVRDDKELRVINGYDPLIVPIMVQYFRQPFYSHLHIKVVETICKNAVNFLEN